MGFRLPCGGPRPARVRGGEDVFMSGDLLTDCGGRGRPLVMVHGLMGRGSTWRRSLPWLTELGRVYTYDAPWHRGRDVADPHPISTERFVADLADAGASPPGPGGVIGHSMGALHGWCLAAQRPELISALVVEDMAPDFRGRTTGPWEPWLHALPVEFATAAEVLDEFGPVAGQYFLDAFDRTATGWRLHGCVERWIAIWARGGRRDYWPPRPAVRGGSGARRARAPSGWRRNCRRTAGRALHGSRPTGVPPSPARQRRRTEPSGSKSRAGSWQKFFVVPVSSQQWQD